jgi:hypothetical protein
MNVRRLITAVTKRFTFSCFASLALGCSGTSEQFFIVQNQIPIAGCIVPGPHSGYYRGAGVYDVGIIQANTGTRYELFPLLQNDLPARSQPGGTDPNRLLLQEFHVQLVPGGVGFRGLWNLRSMGSVLESVGQVETKTHRG